MHKEGESLIPTTIVTVPLSQGERYCIDRVLCLYEDAIRGTLPPSVQRGEILTTLTDLRESLALLDRMQEGEALTIDSCSAATVQDAFTFFVMGIVPLLCLDEQEKHAIVQEAETLQRFLQGR